MPGSSSSTGPPDNDSSDTNDRQDRFGREKATPEKPLSVLLVEDNPGDARLFEEYLDESSTEAVLRHRETLQEGLRALREARPDVLVADLGLPDSQGAETIQAIATAAPEVPIVVLTGQGDLKAALAAQEAGATEYLQKEELTPALVGRTLRWATQRRRMQAKLRQRDAWIRSITEGLSAGVFRAGPTGQIVYANEALAEMLGFDDESELVGRDLTDFYADPTQRGQMLAEEGASDEEVALKAKDGSAVVGLLSAKAAYDASGRTVHYDGTVVNITEEAERKRKLRVLSEAIGQAKEAVLITEAEPLDKPGPRVVYVNEAFEEMTGWAEEEILGKTPRVLQGPETDRRVLDSLREALEAGEEWEGETVNYRKSGEPYRVQWNLTPVRNARGDIEYWVSVQRDVTERKKREQALAESEARYRAITESARDAIITIDSDSTIRFANPAVEDIFGYDPAELVGEPLTVLMPERFREEHLEGLDRYLETGEPRVDWSRTEFSGLRKDGQEIDLSISFSEHQRQGKVHFEGIIRDITDQKRRERVLENRREKVEALYEATRRLLGAEGPEAVSRHVHKVVEEVFGYDLSNTGFVEKGLIIPMDVAITNSVEVPDLEPQPVEGNSVAARALRAGATVVEEGTGALENEVDYGDLRAVAAVPIGERGVIVLGQSEKGPFDPFDLRLIEVLAGYGGAVLERFDREEALREERDLLGRLLATSPAAVVVLDSEGQFIRANDRAEEILGIGPDEVTERAFNDPEWGITAPDGSPIPEEELPFAQVVATGEPVEGFEHAIEWPDGTRRILSVSGAPLRGAEGALEGAVFHLSDVTEQKRREQELIEAKEQAEEAARLKTALLANMSHEIRTPLTSIIGFAELLKGQGEGEAAEFAERIRQGGERLMRTLNSVLELSRLEAETEDLSREEVSLRDVVRETIDILRPSAEEKSIALETELPEGAAQGSWNEGALSRILENLIENAIKFTPEGGRVEVRAAVENGEAVLEVEDTGIGISEEVQPEIFRAFKQESEGKAREYEGTGLGLSITQRLAEAHGGSVAVESKKGEGSCFTVRLPIGEEGAGEG